MSIAIANPEELRKFSYAIQRYLEELDNQTNALLSAFNNLENTWKDHQAKKFKEELDILIKNHKTFKENVSDKIPHLRVMAEDLENYLGR